MSVPKKHPQPGLGAPLTAEREQYRRLMAQGLNNHQACLQIGVNPTTGMRWSKGRNMVDHTGKARYYLPAPKSTGKELFHADYAREMLARHGGGAPSTDDLLATLTELTAVLVARACRQHQVTELVVAGGGARNPTLMRRIAELSAPAAVTLIDDYGLPAQGKEAYLFAVLGYLTLHGLPGTVATATGAREASVLGSITPGRSPLTLPPPAPTRPHRLRIASA